MSGGLEDPAGKANDEKYGTQSRECSSKRGAEREAGKHRVPEVVNELFRVGDPLCFDFDGDQKDGVENEECPAFPQWQLVEHPVKCAVAEGKRVAKTGHFRDGATFAAVRERHECQRKTAAIHGFSLR